MGYVEVEQRRFQPRGFLQHRRISAQDLLFMLPEEFHAIGSTAQKVRVVEETSAAEVTVVAEESSHHTAGVTVVDVRRTGERLPADETEAVLAFEHPVVRFRR
jgi:hypothetical protein